jgi:hypothetical protein
MFPVSGVPLKNVSAFLLPNGSAGKIERISPKPSAKLTALVSLRAWQGHIFVVVKMIHHESLFTKLFFTRSAQQPSALSYGVCKTEVFFMALSDLPGR